MISKTMTLEVFKETSLLNIAMGDYCRINMFSPAGDNKTYVRLRFTDKPTIGYKPLSELAKLIVR